jgi:DNA-binding CsgD family transcriptional regulator
MTPSPSPSRLIGRDAELDRLATTMDAAAAGRPAFLLVVGEAGIGKSALLVATARRAEERGLRVLAGSAVETGATIPYLPLIGPLATAVDGNLRDAASTTVRRVVRGEMSESAAGHTADAERAAAAARFIEAVFDVLVRRPTLLVVDDVHWADRSSVTVLDYLSRRAADVPFAIIAAARDDEHGGLLDLPIADGRRFERVALRRLDRSEVAEQVTGLLGHRPTVQLVDQLFARSAGNPMFVEELLSAGDEGTGDGATAMSSAALRGLVLGRAGRLSAAATTAVQALAVIGRPADDELVAAVAGTTPEAAARALDVAVRGGVATTVGGRYDVRHPIVGEVVAASIPAGGKRRLHRRAAEALDSTSGPGIHGERARQWLAAGDERRAWEASLEAADEASRAYAFAEAATALRRAVDLWPPDEPGLVAGMLNAADVTWMSGDAESALALARRAESRADADATSHALELTVAIGRYAWDAGERATATRAFVRANELVRADTPAGLRSRALWGLGRGKIGEGDFQAAYDSAVASADAARASGEQAWESEGWLLAGMAKAWMGVDGTEELRRGLDLAIAAGDPGSAGHGYQFLVDMLTLHGRRAEALALAEEGAASSDRLGTATTNGSDVRGYAGLLLIDDGRWPEAEAMLRPAHPRAIPSLARALLATRRGDFETADEELAATVDGPSIGGRGLRGGNIELARTELAWLRGDVDGARREFAGIVPSVGVWMADMHAWQALWGRRLGIAASGELRPRHPDERLDRALEAEITAEGPSADARPEAWAAAADAWAALGWPYHEGWARLRQAEAGFAGRDRDPARKALHEAARIADALGAAPLSVRVVDLARRARVSAHATRRTTPDVSELTAREADVLVLVAEGQTNRQVAESLFLSPKTVELHVSRILDKLGARTRGEAVAKARRSGLLTGM